MRVFKALLFLIGILTGIIGWFLYENVLSGIDLDDNSEVILDVKPGTTLKKLAHDLHESGFIRDADIFYYYVRILRKGSVIKAGEYSVKKSMSPMEMWSIVASGRSVDRIFTVREGLNSFEISQIFERGGFGTAEEFLRLVFDRDFAVKLTGVEGSSLEGYLFPDTYKLNKYIGAKECITIMVKRSVKVIEDVRRATPTKMTIPTMVTIASIVEKETGSPDERVIISSVVHNRLAKGMKLQMDPTVIYGFWRKTGKYIENIKRSDLLEPNDYNTYTFYGLPAGPISNPGRESLHAALNPAKSGFLYFVSRNNGTHVFSETLKDHNKAVGTFQLDQKNRIGKSWRNLKKSKKLSSKSR